MTGCKLPFDQARGKKVDFKNLLLLFSNNPQVRRIGARNFGCSFMGLWDVRPVFLFVSSPGRLCPQSKPLAQELACLVVVPPEWGLFSGSSTRQARSAAARRVSTVCRGVAGPGGSSQDPPVKSPNQGVIRAAGLCPAASGDARQPARTGKETSQTQAEPGCPQGALCSPPG
jgi:hypothetical protein